MVWGSSFAGAVGDIDVNGNLEADTATINQSTDTQSLTSADSVTVTDGEATDTLHYGSGQDRANAGNQALALGFESRAPTSESVSVGYQAGKDNTGDSTVAVGRSAAKTNSADFSVFAGNSAGATNTGRETVGIGRLCASGNTADTAVGVGRSAIESNTGANAIGVGFRAGRRNTGSDVIAVGPDAASGVGLSNLSTMGSDNICIGSGAGQQNQASGLICLGTDAGFNAQTDDQLIITDRNGNRRMVMDLTTGDMTIEGTLTENGSL